MVDLDALRRAWSLWQLSEAIAYFDEMGDRWEVGVLSRCAEKLSKHFAEEVGATALKEAMEAVLSTAETRTLPVERRLH